MYVCSWFSRDQRSFCGLPRWLKGKESACSAGDKGFIPGSGRSPEEGSGNPFQYSCLENPMDTGAWRATVHGVAQRGTWLSMRGEVYIDGTDVLVEGTGGWLWLGSLHLSHLDWQEWKASFLHSWLSNCREVTSPATWLGWGTRSVTVQGHFHTKRFIVGHAKWENPLILRDRVTFSVLECMLSCFSHGWLFVKLWTAAHQAPLSVGFSRQEYWSGLPCSPPEDLPNPGIKPTSSMSPLLQQVLYPPSQLGSPLLGNYCGKRLLSLLSNLVNWHALVYLPKANGTSSVISSYYYKYICPVPQFECSTWMQSQKWQNDLCLFPRQTIQYHSNPSLCPKQ